MILLDATVLVEPLRPQPNRSVLAWLDHQSADTLFLACMTQAGIGLEIACLPEGQRKEKLRRAVEEILDAFRGRLLAFDADAAKRYGEIAVKARFARSEFHRCAGYLAAIAAAHRMTIATRHASPYEAAGVAVVNPFQAILAP